MYYETNAMVEWLWDSFLLFIRILVVLSIITTVSAVLGWLHAWWNEGGR